MTTEVVIPVRMEPPEEGEDDDGWVFLTCDAIQGCHAMAETVEKGLEYIADIARVIFELQHEENLPLEPIFEGAPMDAVFKARMVEEGQRA